jgi:hypothetical protein
VKLRNPCPGRSRHEELDDRIATGWCRDPLRPVDRDFDDGIQVDDIDEIAPFLRESVDA